MPNLTSQADFEIVLGMVNNVIEMRLPLAKPESMYLYGRTLLRIAKLRDEHVLFDTDGAAVCAEEFYEVTSAGIKRVA